MRCAILGFCVLVSSLAWMSPTQSAQSDGTDFPPARGARVRMDAISPMLYHHTATVMACTSDTLWIGEAGQQPWAVPVRSITRLEVWRPSGSRGHHMLVGAGVGALIGGTVLGLGAATIDDGSHGDDPITPYAIAIGVPAGLAVGTVVGALRPTGKWVGVALPEKTSLQSPGNGRFELKVTMRRF